MSCLTNCGLLGLMTPKSILDIVIISIQNNEKNLNKLHPINVLLGDYVYNVVRREVTRVFKYIPTIDTGLAIFYTFLTPTRRKKFKTFDNFVKTINENFKFLNKKNNYKIKNTDVCNCYTSCFNLKTKDNKVKFCLDRSYNYFWRINKFN